MENGMKRSRVLVASGMVFALGMAVWSSARSPAQVASTRSQTLNRGTITLLLDEHAVTAIGLSVAPPRDKARGTTRFEVDFALESAAPELRPAGVVGALEVSPDSVLRTRGAIVLAHGGRPFAIVDPTLRRDPDGRWIVTTGRGTPPVDMAVLDLGDVRVETRKAAERVRAFADVMVSEGLAESLGAPGVAGEWIGRIQLDWDDAENTGVADLTPLPDQKPSAVVLDEMAVAPGPDVIVGEMPDIDNYGTVGAVAAFAVGTISCNAGTQTLNWVSSTNQHPVIGQNLFRLKDGRFEQIGQAWVKHGFATINGNVCGFGCQDPGSSSILGVGCSDPYSAGLNGAQYLLGPKSEINPFTGEFPYPPILDPATAAVTGRRLQVFESELSPQQQGGGEYFIEGHYITADDSTAGNQANNASYRPVDVSFNAAFSQWELAPTGITQREKPAIRAWRDQDPSVLQTDITLPHDGLMILGAKATDIGGGLWQYEYALQNLNSDRSAGSFRVPVDVTTTVSAVGFKDVEYHSGEVYNETDWNVLTTSGAVTWSTVDHAVNPNANALRWGTLYNYRFQADAPPQTTSVTIGLFKPGTPSTVNVTTTGPTIGMADCNTNGIEDSVDIANGTSRDCNGNVVPDECEIFPTTPITAIPVVTGLSQPVYLTAIPSDPDRLIVVEQAGRLRLVRGSTVFPTPFLDISSIVLSGGEQGLLSVAFHPDYNVNGFFYVNYTNTSGNTVIAQYSVSAGDPEVADPGSAVILKTIVQPFANHNGGQLQFGPDGFLYVGMGDGGDGNDPLNHGQNTSSLLGKMLRLDVDNPPTYIPASNPFVGPGAPLDEIWATGLRNPWRFSFDSMTGDLFIADVGQSAQEEIDWQPASSTGSENYGWRCMEGDACTGLTGCTCNDPTLTLPILSYDHSAGDCSITGGYVYRGCAIPDLAGTYFYADYCSGFIGSFRTVNGVVTDPQNRTAELTPAGGAIDFITSFGEDSAGELYIISHGGTIYRIEPNTSPPPVCGNNVVETGETCDDGNTTPGDGCDANCQTETGGNNDNCADATSVSEGTFPFDNSGATTDGPDEPTACNFFGFTQVASDLWYRYTPTCTGTATISLCGSGFDTKLAVYPDDVCPTTAGAIACNDDACATQSELAVSVNACGSVLVRVGSYQSAQGAGTMTISCQPSGAITDCNGNGIDDAADIACGPSADVNGNGVPDECESPGDAMRGGRLYDRWWTEIFAAAPTTDHPLWAYRPDPVSNTRTGSATWRCKECHAWDYRGVDGAYGTGTHRTGFPGVLGTTLDGTAIFTLLKDPPNNGGGPGVLNGHDYGMVLLDTEINDLVAFVLSGVIDQSPYIDSVTKEFFGDPLQGETHYTSSGSITCITCHGSDGTSINFGTIDAPEYVGTVAVNNPWELMHKIRVGQPGTSMPSWTAEGGDDQGVADIGRYAQLNFPVECVLHSQCDDGVPCTDDVCSAAGRCEAWPNDFLCAEDGLFCNGPEICDALLGCASAGNPCADPAECDETGDHCGCTTPVVWAAGSRYVAVETGSLDPATAFALVVTPDCLGAQQKYVGAPTGPENIAMLIDNAAAAAYLTPAQWGAVVFVSGLDVVPNQSYLVQADCGAPGSASLTVASSAATAVLGDVVGAFDGASWALPDGAVTVLDLTAVVEAFGHQPTAPAIYAADIFLCDVDRTVSTLDFVAVIDGFQGLTYSQSSQCPTPCP